MKHLAPRKTRLLLADRPNSKNRLRKLISFLVCLLLISVGSAQTIQANSINQNISAVEIKIALKDETLIDAFQKIEKLTPFRFMYRKDDVKYIKNLNLVQTRTTVEELLHNLLTPNGFTFKQVDTRILVKARQTKTANQPAQENMVLATNLAQVVRGKVMDENGEPLPGVVIVVKGTAEGTSTDASGNYQIEVPGESAVLIFSFIGFKTLSKMRL